VSPDNSSPSAKRNPRIPESLDFKRPGQLSMMRLKVMSCTFCTKLSPPVGDGVENSKHQVIFPAKVMKVMKILSSKNKFRKNYCSAEKKLDALSESLFRITKLIKTLPTVFSAFAYNY